MIDQIQKKMKTRKPLTEIVHAGEEIRNPYGSVTTPIVQTVNFYFHSTTELAEYYQEKKGLSDLEKERYPRFKYGRTGNPTQHGGKKAGRFGKRRGGFAHL